MMEILKKKGLEVVQLIIGTCITTGILYQGYYHWPIPTPNSDDFMEKLVYSIRSTALPAGITLYMAVMMVAIKRSSTPAGNPLAGKEKFVLLEKCYLTNTIEQALILMFLVLTMTTYLQFQEMKVIPIYSGLWVLGRMLFRIGYGINPRYRTLGMGIHNCTSFYFFFLIFYLIFSRGLMI